MPTLTEEARIELQGKTHFSEEEYKELVKQGKIITSEGNPLSTNGEIQISILYPEVPFASIIHIPVKNKTYLETKKYIDEITEKLTELLGKEEI